MSSDFLGDPQLRRHGAGLRSTGRHDSSSPEWDQYAVYASWTGLALVVLYTLGQWREIVAYFQQRNARYGALAGVSVLVVLGILVAVNYLSTQQNKRWDLTANRQYSLSEQTVKLLQGLKAPVKFIVFDQEANVDRVPAAARRVPVPVEAGQRRVHRRRTSDRSRPRSTRSRRYGTVVVEYMGRRERVVVTGQSRRAGPDERADQGAEPDGEARLLPGRPRRKGPDEYGTRRATARSSMR